MPQFIDLEWQHYKPTNVFTFFQAVPLLHQRERETERGPKQYLFVE